MNSCRVGARSMSVSPEPYPKPGTSNGSSDGAPAVGQALG